MIDEMILEFAKEFGIGGISLYFLWLIKAEISELRVQLASRPCIVED